MNEQLVYLFSCILSCAISIGLLIQFLDNRFNRTYTKKWIYWCISILSVLMLALLNQKQNSFLNTGGFLLCAGLISVFLYTGKRRGIGGRIIEADICIILMGLFEGIGVYLCDIIMQYSEILPADKIIMESIEVIFSKIILLFLYYVLLRRFWKKEWKMTKEEYLLYLFMFIYSILNLTIIFIAQTQMTNYLVLCVNWCSLLFANLYVVFHYIQISEDKKELRFRLAMMEQQEQLQFEYYQMEKGKYEKSLSILHDVSKHIRSIETLYHAGEKLGISFQCDLKNVELGFMDSIDVTTLFGNLLENAMEACGQCTGQRRILLKIKNRYDMLAIHVENTVKHEVCLIEGKPVHPGQHSTGIGTLNIIHCVEKYGGSIIYKNNPGSFICDILLNK